MQALGTYITNFINNNVIPLAVIAIFVALVAVGFGMVGTQGMKQWAKGHIFYIVVGGALIYVAAKIATEFAASFGF